MMNFSMIFLLMMIYKNSYFGVLLVYNNYLFLFLSYIILEVNNLEITFKELLELNNPNIIDIRSIEKYNDNHVPGSVNINYNLLISNPGKYLSKDMTYYIYCQRGITSIKLVEFLRRLGYRVYSIIGGYEAYILN